MNYIKNFSFIISLVFISCSDSGDSNVTNEINENEVISPTIENIAGNGTPDFSGDNGNANEAELNYPRDLDFDSNGNIYISDRGNNRIRKIDLNGIITTVAGSSARGYSGDGGLAINAQIHLPLGIKIDSNDNIYFIDNNNHCVRKIDGNGIITTIAGNGTSDFSGDGGLAINASLSYPQDLTIDSAGNIYILDTDNRRIRKIDANGIISTIAGNGNPGFNGEGVPAINAHTENPTNIHIDANSNIYFSDWANSIVRKIDNNGIITTIAGNGTPGFSGDGGLAINALLNIPSGLTTLNGSLYITDRDNYRIRKIDENGIITTYAGETYGCVTNSNLSDYRTKGVVGIISNNDNLYVVNQICSNISKINDSSL